MKIAHVQKLKIAQVQKLQIAQVQKFMKIAQVHPNLVAREDALEYVEVGINIDTDMDIYYILFMEYVKVDKHIKSQVPRPTMPVEWVGEPIRLHY